MSGTHTCGQNVLGEYNLPLHIAAVFIVLATSGIGVGVPLITGRSKGKDGRPAGMSDAAAVGKGEGWTRSCFFVARHFGTGIILSTSFIHLLYEGLITFANPCVGNVTYDPTAPAIALAGAFVTFVLDFVGIRQRIASLRRQALQSSGSFALPTGTQAVDNSDKRLHPGGSGVPQTTTTREGQTKKDLTLPAASTEAKRTGLPVPVDSPDCCHADLIFQAEQGWQVMLLEAGIIFHSIMIGVTLGADSGDSWTTLLIVIVFHQFFEGAALGARIAVLTWISRMRAFLMGLAFTLITPIGIGIGIGVRTVFSENGVAELISVGVLNSFSAGILLYTAFKLLSADFTEGPLRDVPVWKPTLAMLLMAAGMAAMAVIGKWA